MAGRNSQKLLIALIIGVVTAVVAMNQYSDMQRQLKEKEQLIKVLELGAQINSKKAFKYITAARDMLPGETVTRNDVKLSSFADEEPDGLTSEEMVLGNVLLESVKSGEVLTGYDFTGVAAELRDNPLGMRDGYRALSLSTSSLDGLSSQMKQGMLIDIFSKGKDNDFALSKIKILSLEPIEGVDKKELKDLPITKAKTATFEVPLERLQDFVEIYSSGKILLVLRPTNDTSVFRPKKKESQSAQGVSGGANYREPMMTSLPELPKIQTYEDATINEMPSPIQFKSDSKTVEIIEASTKSHVTFDE